MSEEQRTRTASTPLEIPDRDSPATSATVGDVAPEVVTYEPGAEVGRYVVLGKLGEGGMGIVLRAYDPDLDRQIALKLVRVRRRHRRARTIAGADTSGLLEPPIAPHPMTKLALGFEDRLKRVPVERSVHGHLPPQGQLLAGRLGQTQD